MKKNGYTLVELVTTILILGIITLIAIPVTSIQLKNSRRNTFSISCEKIFGLDEKYEMVEELLGEENECVVFDFDKNVSERQEINGEIYEPISSLGLQNTDGFVGQYRLCKGKKLLVTNGEFTCVYDTNNKKVLDTNSLVVIPALTSIELVPTSEQVSVTAHVDGKVENYYYKLNDGKFVKSKNSTHIFNELKPETKYAVTVYVEDKNEIKSDKITRNTVTKEGYAGVPDDDYEEGDEISYADEEFIVVEDNEDSVTLISKYNVTTGKFGNTTSWNDSTAKSYLNNDWVNSHPIIKRDIEKNGIIYNEESNSYIRMITKGEAESKSTKIKNYSNTPFWTMTAAGSNVYYADKKAKLKYDKKGLAGVQNVKYYSGTSDSLSSIEKNFESNECSTVEKNIAFLAKPTTTTPLIGNACSGKTTAEGYDSYTKTKVEGTENCNCKTVDCDCEDYACQITQTSTSVVYDTYCAENAQGFNCTSNGCVRGGNRVTGSHSCGRTSCGQTRCSWTSCNTYSYSAPGCKNGVKCMTTKECGPVTGNCNKSCDKYCDDVGFVCDQEGCVGGYNYNYCNKTASSVKSTDTKYSTISSTCTTCKSTCEECETCEVNYDKYDASGNKVTYTRYNTVSETTSPVMGIRAVLTVKKKK